MSRQKNEEFARELAEREYLEEKRRKEEEEKQRRLKTANWNVNIRKSDVLSLKEIQAQEEEREKGNTIGTTKGRLPSKGDKSNIRTNNSWAGKLAATSATAGVTKQKQVMKEKEKISVKTGGGNGFWEPPQINTSKASEPRTSKKAHSTTETETVDEFDKWCNMALSSLSAKVDFPTFLGFLKDIESPYEVYDYVKSYIGDGKQERKFAEEYLEKRSVWKNSKKKKKISEDDLTTPAAALSPGEGEFQETKKSRKKTKKSNLNHLLGFSVQGKGVNRGEIDISQ